MSKRNFFISVPLWRERALYNPPKVGHCRSVGFHLVIMDELFPRELSEIFPENPRELPGNSDKYHWKIPGNSGRILGNLLRKVSATPPEYSLAIRQ